MIAGGGVGPENEEVQVEKEMRVLIGAVTETSLGHLVVGRDQGRDHDHLVVGAMDEATEKIIMTSIGARDQVIDTETTIWMREAASILQWYYFYFLLWMLYWLA